MKTVQKFINEATGEEFTDQKACETAEARSSSIKKIFSFWGEVRDPKNSCDFSNGKYCYQRAAYDRLMLAGAILTAIKLHVPALVKKYTDIGGLKLEHVSQDTYMGRYLSETNSEIYRYLYTHGCICHNCYRQYGQLYYAINCKCDGKIETRKVPKT